MSKVKRYLLFAASALLLATSVFALIYAFTSMFDAQKVDLLALKLFDLGWFDTVVQNKSFARIIVSLIMSSGVITVGFAVFALRFAFYSSQAYYHKQSVLITMAVLYLLIPMPIIIALNVIEKANLFVLMIILAVVAGVTFMTSTIVKDKNYVPEPEVDSEVDMLEVKLTKLKDLKEKGLITEEEFNKLRLEILNKQ